MEAEYSAAQKKAIGAYTKKQIDTCGLSQAAIARNRRCSASAVNMAIWQIDPLHVKLLGLKNFIAQQTGYSNWAEICAEALNQEKEREPRKTRKTRKEHL